MTRNIETVQRSVVAGSNQQHLAARRGYTDAKTQQPYPYEYDDWSKIEQLAYETGRLWHANLVGARVRPPGWPARKRNPGPPPRLMGANIKGDERAGSPIPVVRLPPSEALVLLETDRHLERLARQWRRRRVR